MPDRRRRIGVVVAGAVLGAAIGLSPLTAAALKLKVEALGAGLGFENFSRTVAWTGSPGPSRIGVNLITARADLGLARGTVVSFTLGLPLTTFKGLAFAALPISLELGSGTLAGFSLGAEAVVPVRRYSDIEISGTGRFVSSFGMSRTWALGGFAVEGKARGEASWIEAAAGPRVSYLAFGRVVPFVEVWLRWLHAGFRITETLADLTGREAARVRGDLAVSVSLGADAVVTDRIAVKAKAGILPYAGGVDGLAAVGVAYKF